MASFKICKPGHISVNIAWVDVVHHNVLPRIRVHLTLVDPDRDCSKDVDNGGHDDDDGNVDADDDLLSALQPIFDTT